MEIIEVEVDVIRLDCENQDKTRTSQCNMKNEGHACLYCNKLYKTSNTLQKHMQLKHPQDFQIVDCDVCHKKYPSLMSLQKHVRYMHCYEHRCKACYRSYISSEMLSNHEAFCNIVESPCPTCGKIYNSQIALRNHVKYKHPQEKRNWCSFCRRAFVTSRGLANHKAAIHPLEMNCTWCHKDFNSLTALQSHVLHKHTEICARCKLCHKLFATQSSLDRHSAKYHDN